MPPTHEWIHAEEREQSVVAERAEFLKRVYVNLLGALVAFTLLEMLLFRTGVAETIAAPVLAGGRGTWLMMFGAFVLVSWLASHFAFRAQSLAGQYAGLYAYVAAQGLIFVPLLYLADRFAPGAIASAAFITLLAFGGLTAVVLVGRKDFSFLGSFLRWAMILAVVAIAASLLFGATRARGSWSP